MGLSVGAAKCKVDLKHAIGFNMQGFAIEEQKATRIGMDFYSRAFTVADDHNGRVAIAVVDLWACTESIKKEVITRLDAMSRGGRSFFTAENVQVVGTHTHSGPAGISEYRLYNFTTGGFNREIRDAFADAIARSILDAQRGESRGWICPHRIDIADCGRNRSAAAYRNNPAEEQKKYGKDTDTEMIVLDFRKKEGRGDRRIGILTWYPIHGTDIGQKSTVLHGDNKGIASRIIEEEQEFCPIAAFANANAGDVSGNVEFGSLPSAETKRALKHGKQQAEAVMSVLTHPTVVPNNLLGPVACHYSVVDMSAVKLAGTSKRTFVPTLGLATFAGSTEDSTPPFPARSLSEGLVRGRLSVKDAALQVLFLSAGSEKDVNTELVRYIASNNPELYVALAPAIFALPVLVVIAGITSAVGIGLEFVQKFKTAINAPSFFTLTEAEKAGHHPKPITMVAKGLVPSRLPLQLMRIGDLVIAGVPGELTTMAGRRLRAALKSGYDAASANPVSAVAISGYANAYSQYITTPEEYAMQHYEGASTLFGPHTLDAYIQEFCRLVPSG